MRSLKANLGTITARLSLNRLRDQKARRESYIGEWLPEPIAIAGEPALRGSARIVGKTNRCMKGGSSMRKRPRRLSLVKVRTDHRSKKQPFADDMPLIFLGEIPNMPEHGVFVGHRSGRVYSGHHIWQFVELTDDEV